MSRTVPIKFIISLCLAAVVITAAIGFMNHNGIDNTAPNPNAPSSADTAWAKKHMVRSVPLPKPGMPQVILTWRDPMDASKVRPVVGLVDHPEGLNGVYGMDVSDLDPLGPKLDLEQARSTLPVPGAWIIVRDKAGVVLGETPVLTTSNIHKAFQMAAGAPVKFLDSEDPYLDKEAPQFATTTQMGKPFDLAAQKGHKVLLTFYCGCTKCQAMGKQLAKIQHSPAMKGVEVVTVTHMTPFATKEFYTKVGQTYTALEETPSGIASQYDSKTCPRVWYIGPDGKVKYYSHLDEDPGTVIPALTEALRTT